MANEKRLIHANSLLEKIHDTAEGLADCDQQNAAWALRKYAIRDIMDAETVDAVEVVRCRDCKYWGSTTGFCNLHSNSSKSALYWDLFDEDDFCSYGERRE